MGTLVEFDEVLGITSNVEENPEATSKKSWVKNLFANVFSTENEGVF